MQGELADVGAGYDEAVMVKQPETHLRGTLLLVRHDGHLLGKKVYAEEEIGVTRYMS